MMPRFPFAAFVGVACFSCAFGQLPGHPAPAPSVPASALAYLPKPAPEDTLRVQTHIGSFKVLGKGYDALPAGRLEFSFTGTVLLSQLAPGSLLITTGNVRKEYEDKHGKTVYFGKGKMLIVGKFQSCQWFGRDLDFSFKGSAVVRLMSEFDKNQETGSFWFDAAHKNPMQVSMISIPVPNQMERTGKAVKREDFEKLKKSGG